MTLPRAARLWSATSHASTTWWTRHAARSRPLAAVSRPAGNLGALIPRSSTAEHPTVNRTVPGSNPGAGARTSLCVGVGLLHWSLPPSPQCHYSRVTPPPRHTATASHPCLVTPPPRHTPEPPIVCPGLLPKSPKDRTVARWRLGEDTVLGRFWVPGASRSDRTHPDTLSLWITRSTPPRNERTLAG